MKELKVYELMKDKKYEVEVVRIVNIKQAGTYVANGIKPIDIYFTNKLVFVFKKNETSEIFKRWVNHEFEEQK